MYINLPWNTILWVGRDSEMRIMIITEFLFDTMYTVLCFSFSIATNLNYSF